MPEKTNRPPESAAEARLREIFHHWGNAARDYLSAENFRISLNAAIQSIRNVTFALQSEKIKIKNFTAWYESSWQTALKSDPIMKWFVGARNLIVKQSDLKTNSIAIATLHARYDLVSNITIPVDPFLSPEEIAAHIKKKYIPEQQKDYGYLVVEKRWVADSMPEIELLSAIAHAFVVLHAIVSDVHEQTGPSRIYGIGEIGSEQFLSALEDIRETEIPECMNDFQEHRKAWLKLSSDEISSLRSKALSISKSDQQKAAKKYGLSKHKFKSGQKGFENSVRLFMEIAKSIIKVDKHHFTTVIWFDGKGRGTVSQTQFADNEDKYMFWKEMARIIKRKRGIEIYVIGDCWFAPIDPLNPGLRAADSKKRKEGLHVVGMTKRGEEMSLVQPYRRSFRRILFEGEPLVQEGHINFLNEIRARWQRERRLRR